MFEKIFPKNLGPEQKRDDVLREMIDKVKAGQTLGDQDFAKMRSRGIDFMKEVAPAADQEMQKH